jgi:hypothetical protein
MYKKKEKEKEKARRVRNKNFGSSKPPKLGT